MFVVEQLNPNFGQYIYDENGAMMRSPTNPHVNLMDRIKYIRREIEGDDFHITEKPAGMLVIKKDGKAVACFEAKQWNNIRKVETE